ncbi:unnamed protein product [Phytophthora lilii]|uniref:Unnamed protein product n=1 Tax=Phytophthora lilii TaxID=2077276 RepID=A0A9W6TRT9_9STRA|nr:unnamed protein product [Phytophthora lilii]
MRRERPRYVEVPDMEADEKTDFAGPTRRPAAEAGAEGPYIQRSEPPTHFVARRRVRRYPDARWRNYPPPVRSDAAYAMYSVASPQAGEQTQRMSRPRPQRHIYPPSHFAQAEYSPYDYDEAGDENSADFPAYDEAVDLTDENAGANDAPDFENVPDPHQPVHRPRRNLKRPLSKVRSDGPPPPPIYRQRPPYIYDYAYEEEDDEWVTEDEEMAAAYGYPPQYRHVEIPIVRRRRRFNSVSSQQWTSPAGHGRQRMYKRRRIPLDGPPLEHEIDDDPMFDDLEREHIIPPATTIHAKTALIDQLNEAVESVTTESPSGHSSGYSEALRVPADDGLIEASTHETRSDMVVHVDCENEEPHRSTSENAEVAPREELVKPTATMTPSSPVSEPATEPDNACPNGELILPGNGEASADKELQQFGSSGQISPGEVVPLVADEAPNGSESQPNSNRTVNSPARKTQDSSLDEEESRIASPPSSVTGDACLNTVGTRDHDQVTFDASEQHSVSTHAQMLSSSSMKTIGKNTAADKSVSTPEGTSTTGIVISDTIRINNHVIDSLTRMNKEEVAFATTKTLLSAQEKMYRRSESSSNCCHRLEVLCGIAYELQCQISSHSCLLDQNRKQKLLENLDACFEKLLTASEQTIQQKVDVLQGVLEHTLSMNELCNDRQVVESKVVAAKPHNTVAVNDCSSPVLTEKTHDKIVDEVSTNWEDDGWFDDTAQIDPANDTEDQENLVAQISPKKSNLRFGSDFLAVKLEEETSSRWPRELPPFVWSLLARVISSDPQSYVMRVTHKRLMDEIAKGDPYYYLHPASMSKDVDAFSPPRTSPVQTCEFGCRGASALKWERKLVQQISSRMKSFDNVAYSLARSSGGKEVLNRKKMNSIIRKLHLVAMQLHSLVSHLYCVKGQATCKEVDSLPIALNNSHFERKMGVYKSRLKLVVPHKYQQQQQTPQQQVNSPTEPAEELLRDTYEFFPELLLCVDIWGYNYREGQAKRQGSKTLLHEDTNTASEGVLFPLGFFRAVESLAFDFEHDSNGLLRCICDELLNIVCLWNDFKWTDNLESVALDRVISFETDVTASILKILELYAHHLQALWAVRLLDEPEQLRSVHFTQFNAYYSDRSQGSLNPTSGSQPRGSRLSTTSSTGGDSSEVDRLVAKEIVEQRIAEEYWNRKVTALSVHGCDDAMQADGTDRSSAYLLSEEAICSWDQQHLMQYLLRWSDVYAIRSDVNALSAVTNHMLKYEVQKYKYASRNNGGKPLSAGVVDVATKQLLAAVSRAQMLIRDALTGTEKLAFHSASSQLPSERKHLTCAEGDTVDVDASKPDQSVRPSESNLTDETPSSQTDESPPNGVDLSSNVKESGAPTPRSQAGRSTPGKSAGNCAAVQEEVSIESGFSPEQPELKDLIQLLAVTKQDMQELCGHRPRSARMREKVQAQSVQLARQTVEIFRNIRTMYAAQRR